MASTMATRMRYKPPPQPKLITCYSFALAVFLWISTMASSSPIVPLNIITEKGGCNMSYYDENMQVIYFLSYTNNGVANQSNGQQQVNSSWPIQAPIGLDCQNIQAEQLHEQFNRLKQSAIKVVSLCIKDSNLTSLSDLPQGSHELRKLIISNTSIDLEVLKEGSEALVQLTSLEISNEKISNIPRNFFREMQSLKELRLDNDEIASLDGDAFHNLDDSLEILTLRKNRFNRFPMAVKNLAQLNMLDLSDNDIVIDTQDNDLPEKLEPLLNLRDLVMNRINCTCEFSSSPFFEWIVRTHIYGVRCSAPDRLRLQEVIVFQRDDFCPRSSGTSPLKTELGATILLVSCFLCLVNSVVVPRAIYLNYQ